MGIYQDYGLGLKKAHTVWFLPTLRNSSGWEGALLQDIKRHTMLGHRMITKGVCVSTSVMVLKIVQLLSLFQIQKKRKSLRKKSQMRKKVNKRKKEIILVRKRVKKRIKRMVLIQFKWKTHPYSLISFMQDQTITHH